jgi:hypothetical protein
MLMGASIRHDEFVGMNRGIQTFPPPRSRSLVATEKAVVANSVAYNGFSEASFVSFNVRFEFKEAVERLPSVTNRGTAPEPLLKFM